MKRCWFGVGLLAVLLVASLSVTWGMEKIHRPITADLNQAAECAELGDWVNAESLSRRAEAAWNKWEHFRACFADHTPTEEVSAELAALAAKHCENVTAEENAALALEKALASLKEDEALVVAGSLYLAAELRPALMRFKGHPKDE